MSVGGGVPYCDDDRPMMKGISFSTTLNEEIVNDDVYGCSRQCRKQIIYNRVSKSRTIHLTCPTVHTLIGSCEINHRNTTQSIGKCFTLPSSTVSLHSFFSFERGTYLAFSSFLCRQCLMAAER